MSRSFNKRSEIRALVRERAGGLCEFCGEEVDRTAPQTDDRFPSMHHRWQRANGGLDSVQNLLLLCRRCHVLSIHVNKPWAEERGLLLPTAEGLSCPVLTSHGWSVISEDGSISTLSWWRAEELTLRCDHDIDRGLLPRLA